ncbi:unnamed protein product [Adineta ricciae]|uniref:Copper transport protein n=2 Tax=Adineta ricciae TaxID=249248 RepID=A0A814ZUJ3_ADIRI|nr:unnamed protein product [Adineta ricciae]
MASQHNHSDSMHDHMMSQMAFHTGVTETILFESWITTSPSIFLISCIFIFILSILHEGIKEFHRFSEQERLTKQPVRLDDAIENELARMNTESLPTTIRTKTKIRPSYSERILSNILYTTNIILSYSLMLIAMTFNVYLFLAIVLGIGVGHFIFTLSGITSSSYRNRRHS